MLSKLQRKPTVADDEGSLEQIEGEYIPVEASDLSKVFIPQIGVGLRYHGQTRQVIRSSSGQRQQGPNKEEFTRMIADKEGLRKKRQLLNQKVAFQEEINEQPINESEWSEVEKHQNPQMIIQSKMFYEMVNRKGSKQGSKDRADSNHSKSKRASSQSEVHNQKPSETRRNRFKTNEIREERGRTNMENLEAKNDLITRMVNRNSQLQSAAPTNQQNFRELRAKSEDPRRPNTSQKKRVKYNLPPLSVKLL